MAKYIEKLLDAFYGILFSSFDQDKDYIKPMGDGALIVIKRKLKDTNLLNLGFDIIKSFKDKLVEFNKSNGFSYSMLSIGVGITKGHIYRLEYEKQEDFIGSKINLAARLCTFAQPEGLVIDAESFNITNRLQNHHKLKKIKIKTIKGFDERECWISRKVTYPSDKFTIREEYIHRLETHVAGFCVRKKGQKSFEILIAKRRSDRQIFPNKWACGGGQVHKDETFELAIQKQFLEEFGIVVKKPILVDTYFIPEDKNHDFIPGLRFICPFDRFKSKKINLNKKEFSKYKWVSKEELSSIDFIPDLSRTIEGILENNIEKINKTLKIKS